MKFAPILEEWRMRSGKYATHAYEPRGAFLIPYPAHNIKLLVIASSGDPELNIPWEHVSVSTRTRCPNWPEMCRIKDLFWDPEETVMQLHPPRSKWVNNHPYCLHLWRPMELEVPLPPEMCVGVKEMGPLNTPKQFLQVQEELENQLAQAEKIEKEKK